MRKFWLILRGRRIRSLASARVQCSFHSPKENLHNENQDGEIYAEKLASKSRNTIILNYLLCYDVLRHFYYGSPKRFRRACLFRNERNDFPEDQKASIGSVPEYGSKAIAAVQTHWIDPLRADLLAKELGLSLNKIGRYTLSRNVFQKCRTPLSWYQVRCTV
ncbi:unnamed protein product [Nesidiocoris tenuis]|uniref:Uncharacterized protein n=1 Tax=Nesidiocoris tenuis TaxID=355587 RepID=A0A6H5GKP0_9HEMI|nr:unnamed protein product [Nesidiocoris tenuis]